MDEQKPNSLDSPEEQLRTTTAVIEIEIDPEIEAMKLISSILRPLDQDTRNRVLSWVERRLAPKEAKPQETPEERRHRLAVENGKRSWEIRKAKQ